MWTFDLLTVPVSGVWNFDGTTIVAIALDVFHTFAMFQARMTCYLKLLVSGDVGDICGYFAFSFLCYEQSPDR